MPSTQTTTPVTVVTGFLGAGKTTLVDRWLEGAAGEWAIVVNEQGAIGVDGELLGDRGARLLEITGGCVCCTSQAELARALVALAEARPAPARILVETSGAASPAGVVRALTTGPAREGLRLDGVVTVVDGSRLDAVLAFDLAVEQLGFADVVVVSHGDTVSLGEVEPKLVPHAPAAVVAAAAHGVVVPEGVSLVELLDQREEVLHLPTTSAHEAIDAVALRHDGELDEDRFVDWVADCLGEVEARILRLKGILAMAGVDRRVIVQGVGEAVEVQVGRPWGDEPRRSRLVVLGLGLDGEDLERGFAACAR